MPSIGLMGNRQRPASAMPSQSTSAAGMGVPTAAPLLRTCRNGQLALPLNVPCDGLNVYVAFGPAAGGMAGVSVTEASIPGESNWYAPPAALLCSGQLTFCHCGTLDRLPGSESVGTRAAR